MAEVSELTDHTGYWLRLVSNAVSRDFARRLAEAEVSVAEWVLLRLLHGAEALAPSVLAERMGMTKGAISKLADRLLAKGLIARAEDPRDRRGLRLSLSPAGRAAVPRLAALADANDAAHFGVLTAEERATLDRLLRTLVERRGISTIPVD